MTLYLKYRPQKIEELDLENVRNHLKKIVSSKNIPHAFLFSGPKGAGKTSAARILAKIVNCKALGKDGEPCNKCDSCTEIEKGRNLDVVEIDAASNRGIDDVRALKENIMLAPNSSEKKVYILDEAHMLTTEAANAFLKTLEEPPDHVIFILATTDPQKLPETVRSRLVNVNFRKATSDEIARQITRVAAGEKVKISGDAIKKISKSADGSFRDAVKIFEQLITQVGNSIDLDSVNKYLMSGSVFKASDFLDLIKKGDQNLILSQINKFSDDGLPMRNLLDSLIEEVRTKILEPKMVQLIELLIEAKSRMRDSSIDQLPLEIAVVKFCEAISNGNKTAKETEIQENPAPDISPRSETKSPEQTVNQKKENVDLDLKNMTSLDAELWKQILVATKNKNTTIEALLRAAEPVGVNDSVLKLGVYYKFHKERLEDSQNKMLLEEVVSKILGTNVNIVYELTEKKFTPIPDKPLTTTDDKDIISAAKEIFGS